MQRGFVAEILAAYGGLGASMRRQIEFRPREATITAYIMFGCFAVFLSFLPRLLATDLSASPDQSLAAGIIVWFFVVMFFLPLLVYGIGGLSRLISARFGGQGTQYTARLSIAWSLVISAPVILIKTVIGSALLYSAPTALVWLNLGVIALIIWIWAACIRVAEQVGHTAYVAGTIYGILALLTFGIYLFA